MLFATIFSPATLWKNLWIMWKSPLFSTGETRYASVFPRRGPYALPMHKSCFLGFLQNYVAIKFPSFLEEIPLKSSVFGD
jgi:hypothetical protein